MGQRGMGESRRNNTCSSFVGLTGNTPRQCSAPVKCLASKVGKNNPMNQSMNYIPSLLFLGECSYSPFTDKSCGTWMSRNNSVPRRAPNQESPKHTKITNFPAGVLPNNLQYPVSFPSRKFQQQSAPPALGAGVPFPPQFCNLWNILSSAESLGSV